MSSKKGQCPVHFLWSGHGIGGGLARLSILLIFVAIFFNIIATFWFHTQLFTRWLFMALGMLWLSGKLISNIIGKSHT